jgi:hypothetical protein
VGPGWYVFPSVTVGVAFDDNIDGTESGKRSDFIGRFAPGLALGYSSPRVNFQLGASSSADVYADHSENNELFGSQTVTLGSSYILTPRATVGLNGDYTRVQSDTDIVNELGVRVGSGTAQSYSVSPVIAYQFTPLMAGDFAYRFASDELDGVSNDLHGVSLGLNRRFTPVDTGGLTYSFDYVDSSDAETTTSHVLLAEWARQFGPDTTAAARLGPRFTDGDVRAEAGADFAHRFSSGTLSLAYTRTQSIATGQAGVQDVDSFSVGFVFPPLRGGYLVNLAANFTRSDPLSATGNDADETRAYSFYANVSRRLTPWLIARAFYQFTYEESSTSDVPRNVVGLEFAFGHLFPLR